jgi:hypothetical protein
MATEPTTGAGMEDSLRRLPQQQSADEDQADRVEDIGRAQQVSRDSVRQNERQISFGCVYDDDEHSITSSSSPSARHFA